MYCQRCGAANEQTAQCCKACGSQLPTPADSPGVPMAGGSAGGRYAGFWRRLVAYIIDAIVVSVGAMVAGFVFTLISEVSMEPSEGIEAVGSIAGILLGWIYYAGMESSSIQATLGKLAICITVTDMEGARISFARASGRHFGKIISALTLFIGFIMAGFTQRKQALHDIMAGCLVMRRT